ncbi:hypothetical protein BDZ90DRAFT_41312 [Jaminaea rosea]|uniref:Secreted protein n=1 Tax=Jaminaea rosea TaxID=1569628 RepID=A0A316UQH1_9BASI|nr:hypothetical protein BDZ90DRAFT_41312 [Jaminaea rosea]PWN26551.1 hypothetical protein BDZ90DRAFT_41312 [Jaminaea rosea]
MLFLTLFLLPVLLFLHTVYADHSTCSWVRTKKSPSTLGYVMSCSAKYVSDGLEKGHYECDTNTTRQPANWGFLRRHTLEMSTPCGKHGWAFSNYDGSCPGRTFAMCINSNAGTCFYMQSGDDCEWPGEFTPTTKPGALEFWVNA